MKQVDLARQWVTKANLALQESGLTALVTYDPVVAAAELNAGRQVLLVEVERATFETWTVTEFQLRFLAISPDTDPIEAWDQLEDFSEPLREPLEIETAQLSMWQPPNGRPYPCNLLTTTTTEMD